MNTVTSRSLTPSQVYMLELLKQGAKTPNALYWAVRRQSWVFARSFATDRIELESRGLISRSRSRFVLTESKTAAAV